MLVFKLLRGVLLGCGLGGGALVACALWVGPSTGLLGATLCLSLLLLVFGLGAALGFGRLRELRGPRRAMLLEAYDPRLAQRVRSAAELAEAPNGSPELITEMLTSVTAELSALPFSQLVPRPRFWGRSVLAAAGLCLFGAGLLSTREDVGTGLYALTHPVTDPSERRAAGLWVSHVRARITYPAPARAATLSLDDPSDIEVPEGTVIELEVEPRVPVERAVLRLGERTLPFVGQKGSAMRLVWTAERSGPLHLLARVDDTWIEDPRARRLVVAQDRSPTIALEAPLADVNAAADEPVPFVYRAQDDHALSGIELVLELSPGRQRRVRLWSVPDDDTTREFEGNVDVVPAAYGVRRGQTVAVWIEARDRDPFGGPNVGRSPVRTITVGEAEEGGGVPVELLTRARDSGLDTLAERLEKPLSGRGEDAQRTGSAARAAALAKSTRGFVRALTALEKSYEGARAESPTTLTLRDMLKRIATLLRDEKSAGDGREARSADDALIRELEDDVLWLSDLLGREKLDNAQKAIERLSATRARMQKLLEELKKKNDPARRAELLAELARARSELALLSQRLQEAESDVPGDFVNLEALQAEARDNPLDSIEEALKRGDLAAAEKALAELDKDVQSLSRGVNQGSESYASARFAPRNEAIERAQGELSELLRTQQELAKQTGRIAEKARARGEADPSVKAQNQRLEERAERLEKRVRKLTPQPLSGNEGEAQQGAAQRMRDARDALRQQDPSEAEAMARRAADDLRALQSELMLDARMFAGPNGKKMDQARAAQQLSEEAEQLAQEIADNVSDDSSALNEEEGEALRQAAPSQRGLSEKADGLAQDTRGKAPPGLSDGLHRSAHSMKKAASALEQGNVQEAEAHQREAVERLNELNDQLERQSQAGRPQQRGGEGGGAAGERDERVTIPQNGEDVRRKELRRRVLDARRADAPDSFERAVDRYYEEILR